MQRYCIEYTKEYVFCMVCSGDFLNQHGGPDDVRHHVESKKHEENGKKKYKPRTKFFPENCDKNAVIKTEMLFTRFVIEYNVQIASTDHNGGLFRMFPNSKIAEKYSCARTKTSIIQDMAKLT